MRRLVITGDGSTTFFDQATGDHYHSVYGAESESMYVYIEQGLNLFAKRKGILRILEVGLGTGLNCLLSVQWQRSHRDVEIHYRALEPNPLSARECSQLRFSCLDVAEMKNAFELIHRSEWEKWSPITPNFNLFKSVESFLEQGDESGFDLVFYDAFGPSYQPEMWHVRALKIACDLLLKNSLLVTFCSSGEFRRNLQSVGFQVERLEGPPGKREMIRAVKL